jgi:integrase
MIWLLALTGQRRREVAAMEWQELALSGANPLWSLPASRTKNGRAHDVPLAAAAVRILQTVPRIRGNEARFVFTTTGNTPVSGFSRAKTFLDRQMLAIARSEAQAPEKVKLQPWRVHDLRRTSASGMARLGVALAVVERTLNHVSGTFSGIVGVYQRHDFAEEKRAALRRWADSLTELAGGNGHA